MASYATARAREGLSSASRESRLVILEPLLRRCGYGKRHNECKAVEFIEDYMTVAVFLHPAGAAHVSIGSRWT